MDGPKYKTWLSNHWLAVLGGTRNLEDFTDSAAATRHMLTGSRAAVQVAHRGTVNMSHFEAWFDCAAQVEASRRTSPQQRVLWYLTTDSVELRRQAKAKLGDKLVTSLDAPVAHTRAEWAVPKEDDVQVDGTKNSSSNVQQRKLLKSDEGADSR